MLYKEELEGGVGMLVVGKRFQIEQLGQSRGGLREHGIFSGRQLVPASGACSVRD